MADECAVLKNWELDPATYALDTIGEMKFLIRVLSSKCYEKGDEYTPREDNLVYEDYATLVARRQDFEKTVTDVSPAPFSPRLFTLFLQLLLHLPSSSPLSFLGAQLLDL